MGYLQKSLQAVLSLNQLAPAPRHCLFRTSSPLFSSSHSLTASNPPRISRGGFDQSHGLLFALDDSLKLQNSPVSDISSILILYYMRKLILGEVKRLTQDLSANKQRWDLNSELFSSKTLFI